MDIQKRVTYRAKIKDDTCSISVEKPGDGTILHCMGVIDSHQGFGSWFIFGVVDELKAVNEPDVVVYTYYTGHNRFGTNSLQFLLSLGRPIRSCTPEDIKLLERKGWERLE